jgi:tetratricopeptide (TPR) repeat protein
VSRVKASAIGAVAVLGVLAFITPAAAQSRNTNGAMAVFGGGFGEDCWRAAFASTYIKMDSATDEARWKADSIATCDEAIAGSGLGFRDLAATYVNRAILEMSRENYAVAETNLESALHMLPKLAEAHVDLGSTMINMQKYAEGVKETELGLSLKSKEPERAYYNLGIAYEYLGDLQKAYDSYKQAATLAPAWPDPKEQMARFVVQPINH